MKNSQASCGFTLIELVIVISIIAVLAGMLMNRVLFYQEMAEKSAMQQVAGSLQSAMILQYGHRMASNMGSWVKEISTDNPMNWLVQKPKNYAGEFINVNTSALEPGNWAFNLATHELIYVPKHTEYFKPAKDGYKWIRYRTRIIYESTNGTKGAKVLAGATFSPVEPYQWEIRGGK